MNTIIRKNNFSKKEYKGKNKDALRWARKYGTFCGNETVIIYNESGKAISGAKYMIETDDYYRININ